MANKNTLRYRKSMEKTYKRGFPVDSDRKKQGKTPRNYFRAKKVNLES